jgi:hypothetical protein
MFHSKSKITALIFVVLAYAMPVSAQQQNSGPWFYSVDGIGVHQSDADLKDSSGGFARDAWFVRAGVDYAWSQRDSVGLSIGGGSYIYDFDDPTGFGGGQPWDKVNDARVTFSARFGMGETGQVFIVPTIRYNRESGASAGDSRTFGVYAAAAWRLRDNLTIGPGIGVFSRLEHSAKFFPILAIDWTISDRWNLSTGRGLASSQGPGLTLSYKLNDDWSFGLTGRYENIEFRLNDSGAAPGGVGRDHSMPLVFTAALKPSEKLSLTVFTGMAIGGQLKLKNSSGDTLEESDYDPALLFGATFEISF